MIKSKNIEWPIIFAGVSGAMCIFIAAAAAHVLEGELPVSDLDRVLTAVQYQMWHALAILGTSAVASEKTLKHCLWVRLAITSFAVGSTIFCGALYLLSFTGISFFGSLTPIGGLLLAGGWIALGIHGFRRR